MFSGSDGYILIEASSKCRCGHEARDAPCNRGNLTQGQKLLTVSITTTSIVIGGAIPVAPVVACGGTRCMYTKFSFHNNEVFAPTLSISH